MQVLGTADRIVATVEETAIDCDVVVIVSQQHKVGIGRAGRGFLRTDGAVGYTHVGASHNLEHIGKDIVTRTRGVTGIEVHIPEYDMIYIVNQGDKVTGVGRIMCNQSTSCSSGDGRECNRIGSTRSIDCTESNLLVKGLLTELECNGTGNTGVVQGVDCNRERGIVAGGAATHDIIATAEPDIDRAGNGVVGVD